MARQILPIVGAVVGGYFGGPSGAQAGWALGSVIGGIVDPVVNKGPSLGDLPAQTSYEGSPRAIIYGTATCVGYVAAFGEPIKSTETQGGDKGGPETEVEVVHRSYAIAICEGPIKSVLRVWENDKLVYDIRPESEMKEESEKWFSDGNKAFYWGDEGQTPDTLLEANVTGVGETVGFSGTAYMRVIDEDLTDTRGAIPQYRFEVAKETEPVVITLPKILSNRHITGVDGGGSMSQYWTPSQAMTGTGEVWLAVFGFGDLPAGVSLSLYVEIAAEVVWTRSVVTTGPSAYKVQINMPPGFQNVRIGWAYGDGISRITNFGMHFWGVATLSGTQFAYPNDDDLPISYDQNHQYFGVVLDADGDLGSMYVRLAGFVDEAWGPSTFPLGYQGVAQSLAFIIDDLHLRSGIEPADYDVSELEDIDVRGLTLQSDGYSAADAIAQLQGCYFFDKQEPGDKIYYPLRGKPVVATLTIDDLVEIPDLSRREQASEIPRKVNLMYQNAIAGYAPVKATFSSSSPDNRSVLEVTTQVAVVLDVDEAAQMVNKIFKSTSADAQGEIKISIPDKFVRFVPGDCLGLVLRGRVIRLRIESAEWADGVMSLICRTDRQSAYTSNVTGIEIPPSTTPPSTIAGKTEFVYLDIPARIDSEDDLNYLVAGGAARDGWAGWALQRSLDNGANFSIVDRWNDRAVMGALLDPVAAASEHYTDTTNKVRVQLYRTSQVLESLTDLQFLSEGGAFAIARPDGSAEVMQYLDASDEGEGVFTLSILHRGLLNTGGSAHLAGAKLAMLASAKHITAQSAWIGMNLVHRAVSLGATSESATPDIDAFVGRSQIEWPVAYLNVQRDGSNVLSGTWYPRHRFGADVAPIASANFQGYRVTLNDGTTTVSLDTLAPSFTYDASAMAASVSVSVASLNRITGPGPVTSATV